VAVSLIQGATKTQPKPKMPIHIGLHFLGWYSLQCKKLDVFSHAMVALACFFHLPANTLFAAQRLSPLFSSHYSTEHCKAPHDGTP
jgi:hypothetical protein